MENVILLRLINEPNNDYSYGFNDQNSQDSAPCKLRLGVASEKERRA